MPAEPPKKSSSSSLLSRHSARPKVLLDIGFLGHAHAEKAERRGAQRVAYHLFEGLLNSGEVDLSFAATTHLAGAYDFLKEQGLDPATRLQFEPRELRRSRRGWKLAKAGHRTLADRSFLARLRRRTLATVVSHHLRNEGRITPPMLEGFDIYHSPHAVYPEAVQADRRLRKFLTCHDFIPLRNPEYFAPSAKLFMEGVLRCLQPGNFAFCVSEFTRNEVLNLTKMPPERVFVTPLAADPEVFKPVTDIASLHEVRRQFKLGDTPYLLALSAQDRHKNLPHLVRCFEALVASGEIPGYNLVIVGNNPGRNPEVAEALTRCGRHRERIIITGFVPDENLAAVYSGAQAFLFPSLAEGFGIPPLEAMQCGVPVIASNTTSIPEVVGDAGVLLPPTDQDAWCQNLIKITREAGWRAELSTRSIARAKLFSWDRFVRQTLAGYHRSMEEAR